MSKPQNKTDKHKKHILNEDTSPEMELFKKIKKIEIRSRIMANESLAGGYSSVFRGYGMEFQEVREYAIGDDFRRIDWNVTARHNNLFVKTFIEERQLNVMLLIDVSGSMNYGSCEATKKTRMIEAAATVAMTAMANQDKIGAVFFTDQVEEYISPSKNKNTILRLIRDLINIKPQHRGTNINTAIDYAIKNMKRRGVIFIMSDYFGDIDYKKLFIAAHKHDIIPVIIGDEVEQYPLNVGLVDMVDNETGTMQLIDTSSPSYKDFVKRRRLKLDDFNAELKKLNIEPLQLSTKEEIDKPLLRYFEKRRRKIR